MTDFYRQLYENSQPSVFHKLTRDSNGLMFTKGPTDYIELLNYLVELRITPSAIRKLNYEYNWKSNSSTISINLNFRSGKTFHLFYLNTNLFGRVQGDKKSRDNILTYNCETFKYDSSKDSYFSDMYMERSIGDPINTLNINQNDIMISFSATYLLGYVTPSESYHFNICKIPDQIEKLILFMDIKLPNIPYSSGPFDQDIPNIYDLERGDREKLLAQKYDNTDWILKIFQK